MRASETIQALDRFRIVGAVAVAVGVLTLAACGDDTGVDPAMAEGPPDLAVTGTDQVTFEPDTFEIRAGEEITIELTSESGVEHDVVIAGAAAVGTVRGDGDDDHDGGNYDDDLHVVHAGAGQASRAIFVIDEPGTYELYCSVPGHRESGMTGALTVIDGG